LARAGRVEVGHVESQRLGLLAMRTLSLAGASPAASAVIVVSKTTNVVECEANDERAKLTGLCRRDMSVK